MKKFIFQVIILCLVIGVGIIFLNPNSQISGLPFVPQALNSRELIINDKKIKVEIADTQEKRSKGLGGRESLASDSGMLFIFGRLDKYPFWMKGLKFPLDFVYIQDDKVVDLRPGILPPGAGAKDEDLPIYVPREAVNKVLEVAAGTIGQLSIKVGDKILLQ